MISAHDWRRHIGRTVRSLLLLAATGIVLLMQGWLGAALALALILAGAGFALALLGRHPVEAPILPRVVPPSLRERPARSVPCIWRK